MLYVAKVSGMIVVNGKACNIRAGHTIVREGHAILNGNGHKFEPLHVHYDVEQATSAPGERRSLSLPRPKKADEPKDGD